MKKDKDEKFGKIRNKLSDFIKIICEKNIIYYFIILIVSLLVSIPFLKISLLGTGDTTLHLLRIIGLRESITNSEFPFIISPFFCNNFGYATNLFYPQLVTYIPYLLKIFTKSYENAMELFAFFTIFISGLTMFNFTKQISKNKKIALISSVIYLTFPYRFECIYERFAIGEFTALIFIPILFQGLYSLIEEDKSKHYLIAIGAIGMLLCHTITTLYSAIFCIIYILFNCKKFLKKEIIKLCSIDAIFIILVSAFFIVPLVEHKLAADYIIFNAEIMRGEGTDVWDNSASLKQLLTDNGSDKTVSFIIGVPIIIYTLLGFWAYKKLNIEDKKWYGQFFLLSIISLFMVTKLFPWMVMPNTLTMIQFTWRILVFVNLFVSPICAINIYTIFKNIKNKKIAIVFFIICITLLTVFTYKILQNFIEEKAENSVKYEHYEQSILENPNISPMKINREYLTINALRSNCKYIREREDKVYVLSGKCNVSNEEKQALNLKFSIENFQETTLEVPYLYYLGYEIELEQSGSVIKLNYSESNNGFIQIDIPDNVKNANIVVRYKGTIIEKSSYIISLLSLIGFIIYIKYYKDSFRRCNNEKTRI